MWGFISVFLGALESDTGAGKVLSNMWFLFLSFPLSLPALSHSCSSNSKFFAHLEQFLALCLMFVGLLTIQDFIVIWVFMVVPSMLQERFYLLDLLDWFTRLCASLPPPFFLNRLTGILYIWKVLKIVFSAFWEWGLCNKVSGTFGSADL